MSGAPLVYVLQGFPCTILSSRSWYIAIIVKRGDISTGCFQLHLHLPWELPRQFHAMPYPLEKGFPLLSGFSMAGSGH